MSGISKRYPGVVALNDVSLSVMPGEVVALLGENGAGKSTMMKILGGVVQPDSGVVTIGGTPAKPASPADAGKLGIAFVHQELSVLDNLDVAGNINLGREPSKLGMLDVPAMHAIASNATKRVGLDVHPTTPLSNLPIAPHQRVQRGLVRTFQINQLFDGLTPLQTLAMTISQHLGMGASALQPLGHDPRVADRCESLLRQFHLLEVMDQPTQQLAYGKRRLLEIAIALASEPSVLLLDEPVAGVPAGEREELLRTVAALPADVSVLLIEHDMDLVFSFAKSMTVMVNGAVLTEGTPAEMAADARVREVYLGHGGKHG